MKRTTKQTAEPKAAAIQRIAREMGIETIETRGSDSLDFHDIAVWTLREALEAAYEAGAALGAGHETDQES